MVRVGIASLVGPSFWGSSKDLFRKQYLPQMKALSDKHKFELCIWQEDITNASEGEKALDFLESQNVDFILLQVTSFAAGDVINPFVRAKARLGLWAIPEGETEGAIPLNSFCGVNMLVSILGQFLDRQKQVKWFYGDIDAPMFADRFAVTIRAMKGLKRMEGAKIGLVGGIAPNFTDFQFDERLTRKKLGVTVDRLPEFGDIKARALGYKDVSGKIEEYTKGFACVTDKAKDSMEMTVRVYMAFEDLIKEGGYDAIAIGCWPKYRKEFGIVVCNIIGRLLETGYMAACEGDVDSAASMLMMEGITGDMPMLMDLSDIDIKSQSALLWHCGSAPNRFADKQGTQIDSHYKPGSRIPGDDGIPVGTVSDMYFKSEPITIARFTWDYEQMLLLEGTLREGPSKGFCGSRGWFGDIKMAKRGVSVEDMINTIMVQRFQHHYPVALGHIDDEVMECMEWLGVKPLKTVPYRNHMQNILF